MKRVTLILFLGILIIFLFVLVLYRSRFLDNGPSERLLKTNSSTQEYFLLSNNEQVYQGYYSQPVDQSSVKILAKLVSIKQEGDQHYIFVSVSTDPDIEKTVKIIIDKIGDDLPFTLIKQKTKDYDAYSADYVTIKPNIDELIKNLNYKIGQLIILVIPIIKLDSEDPIFNKVKDLVPIYNQYTDCNNQLFGLIKTNSINAWRENCYPRTYQLYVVE